MGVTTCLPLDWVRQVVAVDLWRWDPKYLSKPVAKAVRTLLRWELKGSCLSTYVEPFVYV